MTEKFDMLFDGYNCTRGYESLVDFSMFYVL